MKHIALYTDGACSGNPGRGGWAAVAYNEDGDIVMQCSEGYRRTTNNRMEIMAVAKGLRKLREQYDMNTEVTVYTDSQLVVNTMNQGWAKKTNEDLWDRIENAIELLYDKVTFVKVKGHGSDKRNNLADQIAVAASQKINATLVDEVYENQTGVYQDEPDARQRQAEPEIAEIRLLNCNEPDKREIKVILTNGNTVTIHGLYEGFEQYGATGAEMAVTLDVARRFTKWLNGGKLV